MKLWYHAIVVILMGLGGGKSWRGRGFKVIIHYMGKGREDTKPQRKGGAIFMGGVNASRQNQTSSKILLYFSFHAIVHSLSW